MTRTKILYLVNDLPFFLSHRLPIAEAMHAEGHEIVVAAPKHAAAIELEKRGLRFAAIDLPRGSAGLRQELSALAGLRRLLVDERPDVAHLITAKPIIFGGALCRMLGIPVLASVSGLGHVFIFDDLKSRLARQGLLAGYRFALQRRLAIAIFQNRDNLAVFTKARIIGSRYVMIPGSGVALDAFDPAPADNPAPVVILPARMLWTKGVGEFVEAARLLRARDYGARFVLAGQGDDGNPASIETEILEGWKAEGAVDWIGHRMDIAQVLKAADICVLPSYLEGFPKTLIDAAAAGRPAVTTDVPGCRDAVIDGETGLLCRARDAHSLADALETLLRNPEQARAMGRAARARAERIFAIDSVIDNHRDCYHRLIEGKSL